MLGEGERDEGGVKGESKVSGDLVAGKHFDNVSEESEITESGFPGQ